MKPGMLVVGKKTSSFAWQDKGTLMRIDYQAAPFACTWLAEVLECPNKPELVRTPFYVTAEDVEEYNGR